jgi:serine incorporator 1/3
MIFALNSMLAWLMKTRFMIQLIEKWSYDYIKMDCEEGKCYGVLAVSAFRSGLSTFNSSPNRFIASASPSHCSISSSVFHSSAFAIPVTSGRPFRMGESRSHLSWTFVHLMVSWWGPKVLLWLVFVIISFFIPNDFFVFWGDYVTLIGATAFILLGLVLLVDFAHSWSETCLEKWENSNNSNLWQWILIGSTAGMYVAAFTMTGVLYAYFASSGCTLNQFFISFNLALTIIITILCIHPIVQEYNPRSGLAQSGMVAVYCTYLVMSAVGNHTHEKCNPFRSGAASGTRTSALVLGAALTFIAIAYSTTRAATQSRAMVGKKRQGEIQLPDDRNSHQVSVVSSQPGRTQTPRYQALLAAVEAG